jgi:hypothetical protein
VDLSVFKNTEISIHDFSVNTKCTTCLTGSDDYGGGGFGTTSSIIGSGNYSPGIGPGEPLNVQLALKLIF